MSDAVHPRAMIEVHLGVDPVRRRMRLDLVVVDRDAAVCMVLRPALVPETGGEIEPTLSLTREAMTAFLQGVVDQAASFGIRASDQAKGVVEAKDAHITDLREVVAQLFSRGARS